MSPAENLLRSLSDTALWTAAYRAEESEKRDPLFTDPFARRLAGERGFAIARAVRQPAVRIAVVLRTAAIDRMVLSAVRERGCDTVLNLAAGLDTRAWRLDLPADLRWIDVDLPELFEYKDEILAAEKPACVHKEVRLDLADRELRRALFEQVNANSERVFVLTEGLLAYLEPSAVGELASDLFAQAHFAEWATDLAGPQVLRRVRSASERLDPEKAKTRFAPAENTRFFLPFGWYEAEYVDLFLMSEELGLHSLSGRVLRAAMPFLPRKVRAGLERGLGIVRLGRDRRG